MLSEGNLWKDPLFVAYLGASIVSVIIIHHDLPPPLLPMVIFVLIMDHIRTRVIWHCFLLKRHFQDLLYGIDIPQVYD